MNRILVLFVAVLIVLATVLVLEGGITIVDPDYDTDGDGIPDSIDSMPLDGDNDGTPDTDDRFPSNDMSLSLNISDLTVNSSIFLQPTSQVIINVTAGSGQWTQSEELAVTSVSVGPLDVTMQFNVPDSYSEVNFSISAMAYSRHSSSVYMDLDPSSDSLDHTFTVNITADLDVTDDASDEGPEGGFNVSMDYSVVLVPAYHVLSLDWTFEGSDYGISMDMPLDGVHWYQACDISRWYTDGDGVRSFLTHDDPLILALVDELRGLFQEDWDETHRANMALAMVQSLDYRSDNETSPDPEYWRFPVETLYLGYGDCEDTALLYSVICTDLNLSNVILLYFPPPDSGIDGHAAVGVFLPAFPGYYYEYDGEDYYYAETTGDGFEVGEMPPEYVDIDTIIVPAWS